MLSLLNAGLLPWLAALSIPVVIHLLTRRARRKSDLPTLRFLQKSVASQSKIWKWRHYLALLLRTLAIAALVGIFLKPTWVSAFSAKDSRQAGEIILVDNSESMSYSEGGVTTFAKAIQQAREALRSLKNGDKANVIFCGSEPVLAADAPTNDLGRLDSALHEASPTDERGDAAAAVALAVDQLSKTNTEVRKLVVISDFQRTNWADVRFESVPSDTSVAFVGVDTGNRENLGITSLRVRPAAPRVGETANAEAEVFNSSGSARRVALQLQLSDGRHFGDTATIGPFSSGAVTFPLTFDKPERVELTATLPDDNMPEDNVRRTVVDLRKVANILLLTDEDVNAPTSAAFYLSRALEPDPTANSGFRVTTVRPENLNNPTLSSADAVIVCNTPGMPEVQYKALSRYAQNGGNLVWMLYGDRLSDELAGFGKVLPESEPLPFRLQTLVDISGHGQGYVSLSEARYDSRLLKAFRDTGGILSIPKFSHYYITSEVDQRGEVLLKYDDGTAAAVRTGEGSGNLLLLNMSPAPSWSDLAKQDVFVPLLHEFLKGILLKDSGQKESYPGTPAATTIEPTKLAVTCEDPDGKILPVTFDHSNGAAVIDKVSKPGFYRLFAGADEMASLPVNPHPDETDLRAIDPRELEGKRQRTVSVMGSATADSGISVLKKGIDLWPYLVALAILCLFGEQLVRATPLAKRPAPRGAK
jgi:hypothetical protein